jgi:hypothetical protein
MKIEFINIEEEIILNLRQKIHEAYINFEEPDYIKDKKLSSKEYIREKYIIILGDLSKKFKKKFDKEILRVKKSIAENEINLDTDKYEKYIIGNFKKLKKLESLDAVIKSIGFPNQRVVEPYYISNEEITFWSIRIKFQFNFVKLIHLMIS